MAFLAALKVAVLADTSDFGSGMRTVNQQVDKFAGLGKLMVGGMAAVGAGLAAVGVKSIGLASDMEQSRVAFTTMLGSATKADAFLKQLWDFAAKTPFEFTGLQATARQLMAMGFSAESVIPTMTAIGDAVAGLGGGQYTIDLVTRALGQMGAKGKVSAEEMNQLAESGIPAWKYVAAAIGTDIPTAMKKAEQGALDASTGIKAITDGMERDFGGMMTKQSSTVAGLWSTVKDNVTMTLESIGEKLITTFDIKGKVQGAITVLGDLQNAVKTGDWSRIRDMVPPELLSKFETLKTVVVGAFDAVAGAIGRAWAVLGPWLGSNSDQVFLFLAAAVGTVLVGAFLALGLAIWGAIAPFVVLGAIGGAVALVIANWSSIWAAMQPWLPVIAAGLVLIGGVGAAILIPMFVAWIAATWANVAAHIALAAAMLVAYAPILLIIAAIAIIVGLAVLIIQNWSTIGPWLANLWQGICNAVGAAIEWIKGVVLAGVQFLVNAFMNYTPLGIVISHWSQIQGAIGGAINFVRNIVTSGAQALVNAFLTYTPLGIVISHWGQITGAIGGAINSAVDTVRGALQGMLGFLGGLMGQIVNAITAPFRNIHIPLPHFSGGVNWQDFGPVSVPLPWVSVSWYQRGAVFRQPTLIGVGEAGTEVVTPERLLTSMFEKYLGAQAPAVVVQVDGRQLALALAPYLVDQARLRAGIRS